jgi:hypothetical protein
VTWTVGRDRTPDISYYMVYVEEEPVVEPPVVEPPVVDPPVHEPPVVEEPVEEPAEVAPVPTRIPAGEGPQPVWLRVWQFVVGLFSR